MSNNNTIYAIANKTSIMLKIDMQFLNATYNGGIYTIPATDNDHIHISEFGIRYYTTNANDITEIPFEDFNKTLSTATSQTHIWWTGYTAVNFLFHQGPQVDNNTIIKSRNSPPTYPIFVLVTGLTPNTTYHIGGYYKVNDGNPIIIGDYRTVTTKASNGTQLVFNQTIIDLEVYATTDSQGKARMDAMPAFLDNIFPIVSNIFNDATSVNQTYTPIVTLLRSGSADSGMHFNARNFHAETDDNDADAWRSVIIHELEHNHFTDSINETTASGEFATGNNAIKFMEFATGYPNATYGRIGNHYYPIISSETFDYIDDYLVVMATDVDYLFGTNS